MPQGIFPIQPCAAFYEEARYVKMASQRGLVQRSRLRMSADRVVTVGIFAGIEQHAHDLHAAELRRQRDCPVAILRIGSRKQATCVLGSSQGSCNR